MATSDSEPDSNEDIYTDFLESRGHDVETAEWKENYNKKQCPECGGLHSLDAVECDSCGWEPTTR